MGSLLILAVDQQTLRGCSDGLDKHVVDSCEASETCMLCTSLGGSCNKDVSVLYLNLDSFNNLIGVSRSTRPIVCSATNAWVV